MVINGKWELPYLPLWYLFNHYGIYLTINVFLNFFSCVDPVPSVILELKTTVWLSLGSMLTNARAYHRQNRCPY